MPFATLANVERADLRVVRGDSFFKEFWLSECEDNIVVPLALTAYTPAAEIRQSPTGRVLATPTVTVVDAANGNFTIGLSTTQTSSLRAGNYVWYLTVSLTATPTTGTHTVMGGLATVVERGDILGLDDEDLASCGCG